ncbi:bacterial Ig-like domain protein [Histomonas meleagridis]|uniref:bacterial Ig-like domain protein n=1 Tax=Histomonas meleagridis TaxID=135588 RepID=UPI00355ABF13|nr:bacterial Ig-like domain protein [Histomonas meleagridis]KAH0807043.1 bacterial Ig-like domain protein [Histomonas meleagridis]
MSLECMKNYDIIVIGFMDLNGGYDLQPYTQTVQHVSQYIDLGYGVLLGHDAVGYFYGNFNGYGAIADKFGIKLGTESCIVSGYCSPGTLPSNWNHYSTEFKVKKRGLVTNYPYHIPSDVLPINLTHTNSNAAFGDVWVELGEYTTGTGGNFTEAEAYSWKLDGYSEVRYGNPHFYLTTYKNTAMIQTGHTLASATLYERKLLTNTIYYLYQRTPLQYSYDNSVEPKKLNPPKIARIEGERSIKISTDNNNATESINYKVKSNATDGTSCESLPVQFNLTTYVKEYYYIIDENENTNITEDNANYNKTASDTILNIKDGDLYVHVASMDNFGTLSNTSHLFLSKEPSTLTFSKSNTFTLSNTFSQSNTYTQSNTFTLSNTFSQSNTYTQSNTFTLSLPFGVSLLHSYTLLYSITYTKSITIKTMYLTHSLKDSFTYYHSKNTNLEILSYTQIIYYEYEIISYSFMRHYYVSFYTLVYINEQKTDKLSTKVLIGIISGSLALVLIIIGMILFLVKKEKQKRSDVSSLNIYANTTEKSHSNHENEHAFENQSLDLKLTDMMNDEADKWI